MASEFEHEMPVAPWSEKPAKTVFRATCYPTINPRRDGLPVLFMRGELCVASTRLYSSLFDVGLQYDGPTCAELSHRGALWEMCEPCVSGGKYVSPRLASRVGRA